MPLIWIYNDLGGADENWLIRNALNAGGLMCFGLGAMTIAADPKQYDLTNKAYIWAAMIGSVVLTTVHSQDLPDMDGDSARGRKTIPLIYGESVARYSVAVGIVFWSVACPLYLGIQIQGYMPTACIGGCIVFRTLRCRSLSSDRSNWKLWCVWVTSLSALLVLIRHN